MQSLGVPLMAQLCLVFGVAGLFWPEKFLPVFEVLMFPWAASQRLIRVHSVAALVLSAGLFAFLLTSIR